MRARKTHEERVREYAYGACVAQLLCSSVRKRCLIDAIIMLREELGIFVENTAVGPIDEKY